MSWKLPLTLSWVRALSYRNHSIDLECESTDWFLCDRNPRHKRVKYTEKSSFSGEIMKSVLKNRYKHFLILLCAIKIIILWPMGRFFASNLTTIKLSNHKSVVWIPPAYFILSFLNYYDHFKVKHIYCKLLYNYLIFWNHRNIIFLDVATLITKK